MSNSLKTEEPAYCYISRIEFRKQNEIEATERNIELNRATREQKTEVKATEIEIGASE